MRRNFNTTFPADRTIVVLRTGVVENAAINFQMIVMKAFIHWACRGASPYAIIALSQICAAFATQTQADIHCFCIRCFNPKARVALRVDLRVLFAGLVE